MGKDGKFDTSIDKKKLGVSLYVWESNVQLEISTRFQTDMMENLKYALSQMKVTRDISL